MFRKLAIGLALFIFFTFSVAAAEKQTRSGHAISIPTLFGSHFDAYQAGPENANRALILLHDQWGLNEGMLDMADQFARVGYFVIAIDSYDGRRSNDIKLAESIASASDPEWAKANIRAAIEHISIPERKVAVMGWGQGATLALIMATEYPGIAATVMFYGKLIINPRALGAITGPVLSVFASNDERVDEPTIALFETTLRDYKVPLAIARYTANYGFMDPLYRNSYDKSSAEAALTKAQRFLDESMQ